MLMFLIVIQKILLEAIFQTIYFPIWWYTAGAKYAAVSCLNLLGAGNAELAPGLWLANIFVPMFGQYDIQGRIISFLMRFFQVIARSIALFFWFQFCLALFAAWLALPIAVIGGMIYSAQ